MTFAEKNWGNCEKAVAYQLNFVQLCYGYGNDCYDDYYNLCPHCGHATTQKKDYEYPKRGFSKKDYYLLDTYDYGVSCEMMEYMLSFGIAKDNFRPIFTRDHKNPLGYQIAPVYTLKSHVDIISYTKKKLICSFCNKYEYEYPYDYFAVYDRAGYPVYISENILGEIKAHHIVKTCEHKNVIISLKFYNYIIEKYPRIECRPVFLGDLKADPEYIRLHKNEIRRKKFENLYKEHIDK